MKRVVGNQIVVQLKKSQKKSDRLSGILVDVSEDSLYLQEMGESHKLFVIPRENVLYCSTDHFPTTKKVVLDHPVNNPGPPQKQKVILPQEVAENEEQLNGIHIYVNGEHLTYIPTPPTIKLDQWNENIIKVLSNNAEVQNILAGKVQKSIEYSPGEVYISVEGMVPPSQMPDMRPGYLENSFGMSPGSPTTTYLSPSQMVSRLQNMSKKVVKKDGEE